MRTTSEHFGHWLLDVLGSHRVDPGDEEWFDDYSLVVPGDSQGRGRQYFLLYRGSGPVIRTLDPVTFGRAVIEELQSHLFLDRSDAVYLDAFALEVNGAFVLVPSFMAPPLGRFGRRLERMGVQLARATHVALSEDGLTAAPPPLISLSEQQLEGLERLSPKPTVDRFEPRRRRVDAIFIHDFDDPNLHEISKGRAVHQLARSVVNLKELRGDALKALANTVTSSRCYGLGWTDARTVLDAIMAGATPTSQPQRGAL